jgi:TolA-binding protein
MLALAAIALAMAAVAGGCRQHGTATSAPAAGSSSQEAAGGQSQAERTRAMEEKAREMEKKAAEIQNMQGTEQEKIDAVNKLEQERQELNKTGGDGAAPPPNPQ